MRRPRILAFILLLMTAVPRSLPAQDQPAPSESDRAKQALEGIAAYPSEIRTAILEICTKPDLIAELAKTGKLPDTKDYPDSVQRAAKELLQYPEIIGTLNDQIEIAKIIGRMYAQSSPEALEYVNKMVDEIEKENKECRDQWVNVLTGNPKAIEQLRDALEALKKQKESGQPAADQQPTPDAGDQADVSNDNINVYSAPSPEVTQYIIDNSDSYPDLAAEAIWYWDRWPYWHHWRHWGPWPPYPYPGPWPHPWPHPWPPGPLYKAGQNAPPHPLQDLHGLAASHDFHQNPALLKEWARLNKQSPLPQNILTEDKSRVQTLTAQRQQYPNLTGKLDSFAQQHPEHPVNQWRQGVAPQATTPVATPERPVRGRPTSLSAGELSQPQRISSGVMVHRGSWNAMSGGFYGGAYRGGFHGGGFRR